jgi:AcrR family transcriptional regulator
MDELIRATGLGKATVYRLYPSKDALIGAWLQRRANRILALIDADLTLEALLDAVEADVRSPGFRGCAFNNASIEFADPDHPARHVAREYRRGLLERLRRLAPEHADELALIIDGMYTSAAHLGPDGPAARGPALARRLLAQPPP